MEVEVKVGVGTREGKGEGEGDIELILTLERLLPFLSADAVVELALIILSLSDS